MSGKATLSRRKRWILAAFAMQMSIMVSACTSGSCPAGDCLEPQANKAKEDAVEKPIEPVGKIAYDGNNVTATVLSTGCTTSDHFEVTSELRDSNCFVTLVRNKPDYCRRAPFAMSVSVEWEPTSSCETTQLIFTNPVIDLVKKVEKPKTARQ